MKTWRDYMREHPYDDLGWCSTYTKDGYNINVVDGRVQTVQTPGSAPEWENPGRHLEEIARAVNEDYGAYSGWDDMSIAIDAMQKVSCCECPYFGICAAMDERMDD